jgi:uncharacterized Zn-binding protein involved in type VI secretion
MKAVKVGDIGTEHDGFHPTKVTAGSPNVFIDGKPAARVGDPLEPHDKPNHPKHDREIASGSSTVFINGKPAALTGGSISCGGVTIGSGTVNIGDVPPPATTAPAKQAEEVAAEQASAIEELPVENMVAMNGGAEDLAKLKSWGGEQKEKSFYEEMRDAGQELENKLNAMVELTEYKEYPVSEVRVNNTLDTFEVYGDGKLQATYPVSSGRTGVTDFMLKGEGPTPPGVYYVDPEEVSEVHFISYLKRNYYDTADWGHVRAPLHPADGTETFGRDGFFVHGGEWPGSAGCLDIGQNDIEFFRNVKKSKGLIKIVIKP